MNIYRESTMSNGLKVITSENPHSDVVLVSLWIRSGARYGDERQLGYAHILEHMVLKGSNKYPTIVEFSKAKDRIGAVSDGLTSIERVCFYIKVAKHNLERMFELLADMIRNPILDQKVLENEKQVILQELHRFNDSNINYLWKFSTENIFPNHPLSRGNLGTEASILTVTIEGLKQYYNSYFIPDRSAIISAGGVNHEEILRLTNKYFNDWNIKNNVVENYQSPITKHGIFFKEYPGKQTLISFGFVSKKATPKESLVLDVLAMYLTYGQSSFLYQVLRHENGLVYGVSANNNEYTDANLFYIRTATTKPKEVIELVKEKIENIEKYFTEEIFNELKDQQINLLLMTLSNDNGEYNFIGNSWKLYNKLIIPEELIKEIRNLKYDDFLDVKNKYLNKNNLCISAIGEKNPFEDK